MNDFTASNGTRVRPTGGGMLTFLEDASPRKYSAYEREALREFFRAEEDERLGRWRHPDFPDMFAKPLALNSVAVVREDDLHHLAYMQVNRGDSPRLDPMSRLGAAYFDAHPEPKPWHDAKPGEVWLLEANEFSGVAVVEESNAFTSGVGFRMAADGSRGPGREAPVISSARRIWPEVTS